MPGIDAGTIYSRIGLKLDELEKGILKVHTKLDGMTRKAKTQAQGFGSFWKNAFQTAFGFGIVQIITKVVSAIKNMIGAFSGYQQSMKNVQSVTGAVGEQMRLMEDAAKDAGETTRFTASQAADALYFLGSAGFSAQQSIAALDGVLQLAGATQSDLASTAESVAAIISQYSLEASEATNISNIFAAAIGNSQATMEKLSSAFRMVGPVAAGFNMSVEQTTGALQELFNAGFKGMQAGRALKSALADLAAPTSKIKSIFGKLNIELKDVNPELNSLDSIIDVIGKSGASTSQIISAFGKVAGPQMAVLIKQGGDSLRKYTAAVTDTEAAAEAYKIQNDSLAGSLDFLKSKLEGISISILEKMEPGMRDLINTFIEFLEAAKPVGQILGTILNAILKIISFSISLQTKVFDVFIQYFREVKTPMEKAADAFDDVRKSMEQADVLQKTADNLNKLTDEYEKLTAKTNLTEAEQNRLKTVISAIEKIVPNVITRFDEYGNAIEISGIKSREAARRMLEAKEAIVLEAKAILDSQEPVLKNIIDRDKAEAIAAEKQRNRLLESSAFSQQILSETRRFWALYNKSIEAGIDENTAYIKSVKEMEDTLLVLNEELIDAEGNVIAMSDGVTNINVAANEAEKQLTALQKSNENLTAVELRVTDAEKKLEELKELEEELTRIRFNLKKLDEEDVEIPGVTDEIQKTWNDFKNEIDKATQEARLFGKEQDVLKAKLNFLKQAYIELLDQGLDPTSKTLTRIRQEYDLTLIALNDKIEQEKEDLELTKEKDEALKDVEKTIIDYTQKLKELGKTDAELIELERDRAIEAVGGWGSSDDAIRKAIEAINLYFDELQKNSEETKEAFKLDLDEMLIFAQAFAAALIGLFSQITENRIAELDKQMQAELESAGLLEETERERLERERDSAIEAGDDELAREKEDALKRLDIEEKYEQKKAELQYKAALTEWQIKLAAAGASLGQAIITAVASAPWPANLPAIAFATVLGITQVAAVNAAKPQAPSFESGGLFLNNAGSAGPTTGGVMTELHPPEMILNESQMSQLWDIINNGQGPGNQDIHINLYLDSIQVAKMVEKAANSGQITFKPGRALRK